MAKYFGLRGNRLSRARVFLVVLPSFLLFGYNQSAIGGVLSYTSFTDHFPRIDTTHTKGSVKKEHALIQGTVVAIYTLGCLIGALSSTAIGNRFGRRKTLVIAAIIAAIGTILQGSSFALPQLIAGRIISGIGVGGVNAIVPVWQSESVKPKNRGKSVVVLGIFVASGIAAASWVNFGLSNIHHSSVAWRLPLTLPFFFCCYICSFAHCFPESPRWLVSKGKVEEAREVMSILEDVDIDSELINIEIGVLQQALESNKTREQGFLDLLKPGPKRLPYRFFLAILINFCAQMTGANVITYYAKTIFSESLNLPAEQSSLLAAGILTWKIVAASLAYHFVDRAGRKPLFMISGLGMGLSMLSLAVSVSQIEKASAGVAAVVFLFSFMFFFPLGFLGANFLYAAEIAPQDLRVHFSAVGTASHWLFNFVIAEITPVAFATIGYRYYIVYAVIGLAVVPLVYFLFPETNGRSLEEMDGIFTDPDHWWSIPAAERRLPRSSLEDLENFESKYDGLCGKIEHLEVARN